MFYVYLHRKKDTLEPFYVGKGSGYRLKSLGRRNIYWQRIVAKHGFIAEIVKVFENEIDAFEFEKQLIVTLKSQKIQLANLTLGAGGISGYRHTSEALVKIKEASTGRIHSEAAKLKIKENWHSCHKKLPRIKKPKVYSKGLEFIVYKNNEILGFWKSPTQCSKDLGVPQSNIHNCLKGIRKSAAGLVFKYRRQNV